MGIHHTVLLAFGFERSHYANANKRRGRGKSMKTRKKTRKKETSKKKNIGIKKKGNKEAVEMKLVVFK